MKQLFYKAQALLAVMIMSSILFTMVGMALIQNQSAIYTSMKSDDFLVARIDAVNAYTKMSYNDVARVLKPYESFFLEKNCESGEKMIYTSDVSEIDLDIVDGRNFCKSDFDNGDNVALLSSELKNNAKEENGKLYYDYRNKKYQVVGIFDKSTHIDASDVYISAMSKNLKNEDFEGSFYLWSKDLQGIEKHFINEVKKMILIF